MIGIKIRINVIDKNKRKGAMEPSPDAKRFFSFSKNSSIATEDRQMGSSAAGSAEQTRHSLHPVPTGETLDVLCLMITQPDYNK